MQERIVIADAHLGESAHDTEDFLDALSFFQSQPIRDLYLLGDMFMVWVGVPKMLLPHQQQVLEACHLLRQHHIRVHYVEGNRDYFVSRLNPNPFESISTTSLRERIGEQWVYFSHGDSVNLHDRQYRTWRAFSRNRVIFSLFQRMPGSLSVRMIHALERRLRHTNQRNKSSFPEAVCHAYAKRLWHEGNDAVILGHFHEQHHLTDDINGQKKHLYVLPAWKDTQTYLHISEQGTFSFRQLTT